MFALDQVTGYTFNRQTMDNPPSFSSVSIPLQPLQLYPGAISAIAFGKYLSPDYEVHTGPGIGNSEFIPQVGTRTGTPAIQGMNEIFFNLFLPSGPMPDRGWPVAIFGHGNGGGKNNTLWQASMAAQGIATISINVVGHGLGPLSTLTIDRTVGDPVTFSEGGRGIDQNGDHVIGNPEGIDAAPPRQIIKNRDGMRQTVADLLQLVQVIEGGVDVNGDGKADLDPSRIYYFGQSLGGIYGTEFLAVEPSVRAGVLNVPGGSWMDVSRLGPARRGSTGSLLAARTPSLINAPGITNLDGVPVLPPYFNENLPLRNRPPVINTIVGAMEIQEVFENTEWVSMSGDPLAYTPHLRKELLPGVPAKSVIIQFAKGDQNAPNPTATALVRAGDLADRSTYYRNDLANAEDPNVPKNPHGFMTSIDSSDRLVRAIALGAQEQIATFFASDGTTIIHPEPARFFETPINLPLPEDLNYIP